MPDSTVPVIFTHGYDLEFRAALQQTTSKLRGTVMVETGLVGKSWDVFRLGPSDLVTVNTRHGATPLIEAPHSARRMTPTDKAGAIPLDKQDELRTLIKPLNRYAMNQAASVNRFYDDTIIAAVSGTSVAVDDADGLTDVALADWKSGTRIIASGGTGLTFEKVNQGLRLLNEDEVPFGERTAVISPQGLEDLLAETEVGSADFFSGQAIKKGTLAGEWMGFDNWIVSNRLAIDGSLDRSCLFYHKGSITLGIWEDIYTDVAIRKDLNYLTQVYARVTAGATRTEEAGVVVIKVREIASS